MYQGKNYTGAPGNFAPKMQKRAPENCHRQRCKSLFNVAFTCSQWDVKVAPKNKKFWPAMFTHLVPLWRELAEFLGCIYYLIIIVPSFVNLSLLKVLPYPSTIRVGVGVYACIHLMCTLNCILLSASNICSLHPEFQII